MTRFIRIARNTTTNPLAFLAVATMIWVGCGCAAVSAQNPFSEHIRKTDPLSPEQQRDAFTLPPGFEIQLVAAEPDIQKPLNMAFDQRGRLWITDTTEYPYPAAEGERGRDSIKILEDIGTDGRADQIQTFADGLNIPIGIYPCRGGCIAFSIPHIWRVEDGDGDSRADRRTRLYGPFGYDRDTHGLNNSFRRGFDGWLYACHGFNNITEVEGSDGHIVRMHSGNTYRMRLDGSRIEQFAWGQVNPFGMAIDSLGNLFTADCHSKPVYQLLREGYYPSFGKPHGGLGFVPPMMNHLHGSTAIAGIAIYSDTAFPQEFQGDVFTGNVMTSRINRDTLIHNGSTIVAQEQPDFVTTTDPWFRPVDIRLGPDGALYIADFYNRIIGHYEVPLDHPGRDRHRGRIWRIVYRGERAEDSSDATYGTKPPFDLAESDLQRLYATLTDENITRRLLALNTIVDRASLGHRDSVIELAKRVFSSTDSPNQRIACLWILHRLDAQSDGLLTNAARDPVRDVRVHAMRVLAEMSNWSDAHRALAIAGLQDNDAFVQRQAADALGQHSSVDQIRALLTTLKNVPRDDNHLVYTIRNAIRNHLSTPSSISWLDAAQLSQDDLAEIASILVAVKNSASASFLLAQLKDGNLETVGGFPHGVTLAGVIRHIVQNVDTTKINQLVNEIEHRFGDELSFQAEMIAAVLEGLRRSGQAPNATVRRWAENLCRKLLSSVGDGKWAWTYSPIGEATPRDNPWHLQMRKCEDHQLDVFLSTLVGGEQSTGRLTSPPFPLEENVSFYIAGHDGRPGEPRRDANYVRLLDAESGEILTHAGAPRHDTARRVDWNVARYAGRTGILELVDGMNESAYAWIAVGRIHPESIRVPKMSPRDAADRVSTAADLAAELRLAKMRPSLRRCIERWKTDSRVRGRIGIALASFSSNPVARTLAEALVQPSLGPSLVENIFNALEAQDEDQTNSVIVELFEKLPARGQIQLAQTLVRTPVGAELLLKLIKSGKASARLLRNNALVEQLKSTNIPNLVTRIDNLTAGLPEPNESVRRLLRRRRELVLSRKGDIAKGEAVFHKSCANCHQVAGKGSLVGPQLDGIGNRGIDRVLEDTLDPNRNVDIAFRTTLLVTANGQARMGVFKSETDSTILLVDNQGKEFTVDKKDIVQQKASAVSLMPQDVASTLSEEQFVDLMSFLLKK